MNVSADILSAELKTMVIDEIASSMRVDASEIELSGISYEFSSENLNLREVTRKTIIKAIARGGGKISIASKILGVTRKTLYAMIKKYELGSIINIHE